MLGIELEPELVARANEIARRAGLTNCRFEQGDVTKLDFDGEFDLVVSVDNLEHVEDDVTAMKDAAAARCGPAGRWSYHVPGYERRWLVFGRRVNFDVPGHVRPGLPGRGARRASFATPASRSTGSQYTYGIDRDVHQQHLVPDHAAPTSAARCLYAVVFPSCSALSYLGQVLAAALGRRCAGGGSAADRRAAAGSRSEPCAS